MLATWAEGCRAATEGLSFSRVRTPCRKCRLRAGAVICPQNGAAAVIPIRLLLPPAAADRNAETKYKNLNRPPFVKHLPICHRGED